jgi:hypothetical protein
MNDQQKISRRNYDEAAKVRNQMVSDTINRANKLARQQHQQAFNRHRTQNTSQSVTDNSSGVAKFIVAFIAIAILMAAAFALFVTIVIGLQSSPFG